jgi:endonuclease/exonuclease/phosphatase family metal-dependent hydrolase
MEKDDAQRLRGIAAALRQTDADLVLLTELWHPSHAAALRALLGDRWPHAVQPSASGAARARPLGSGLLLLSKRPITSSAFVPFAQSAGVDRLACKGMLCARIALDAGEFSLIGTHLQANYVDADHQIACDAQIEQLLAALQQRRVDAVLGDFNQAPTSRGFCRLADGLAALGLHCEAQGALDTSAAKQGAASSVDLQGAAPMPSVASNADLQGAASSAAEQGVASRQPSLHSLFFPAESFVQMDYIFAKGLRWTLAMPSADNAFASRYCYGDEDLSDHFPLLAEVQLEHET